MYNYVKFSEGCKIKGICLGRFDKKIGPKPIFSYGINPRLSKKIVMKVMVGSLSFEDSTSDEDYTEESIIPLQAEKLFTFTIFFRIRSKDYRSDFQRYSLSAIFDCEDRLKIYKDADFLKSLLRNIAEIVKIHNVENGEFPSVFFDKLSVLWENFAKNKDKIADELKSGTEIMCPICQKTRQVTLSNDHNKNLIEHSVQQGEVCQHKFTVYLDSSFKILGYKDQNINLKEFIDKLTFVNSPYDKTKTEFSS